MSAIAQRGHLTSRAKAVTWALVPLLLLTPLLLWSGRQFAHQLRYEQRSRTQHLLEIHARAVQRSLDAIRGKLEGLEGFVARQTAEGRSIDDQQFRTFAAGLHASSRWIRAFQIVTGSVITHAYPREGNEATLGVDLSTAPAPFVGSDVVRAVRTGRITVTGPIQLIQGGLGIVIRKPVANTAGSPVYLAGVVLNIAPLLADSGLNVANANAVEFAIRRESGAVFFGPSEVFARNPVTHRLVLPDGTWEMAVTPREGWQDAMPVLAFHLVGGAAILLLGLLVYVLEYSRADLTETVERQTEALRRELAARRQTQEELQHNYSLLHAVTENMSDAVFAKDPLGRYRMINSAGARFLGRTPGEIIGRTDLELFPAEVATAFTNADRQVLSSGRVHTVEDQCPSIDGIAFYQSTKTPWRGGAGELIGVVGVSRDITERRWMEEALRASEKQLSLILNNVSEVVFAIAVEPRGVFRFTSVNRRFLDATGMSEHQVVGALVSDVIPAPGHAQDFAKYDEAIRTGATVRWDEVTEYPTGRKIGQVTVVPVFDTGGVCTQLVGMVHDITERTAAEEKVRSLNADLRNHAEVLEQRVTERTAELELAKERAEAADRVKSSFLATMSHELRTPLNSIIGFTGVMLQGLAGPLNPEQGKQLEMVRDSARHLLALINDVLDISKIEAAQLTINRERVDVGPVIAKVTGMVRPFADRKGLAMRVEIAPAIGTVISDQRRIEQVLLNLLNNAVKFTERGGVSLRVWQQARPVSPAPAAGASEASGAAPASADGDRLHFEVTDTGIGIRAEELPSLFQPFRQIDTGLSRLHEGTGLGLAICRRLAELMGGEITARSEWGQGSTFTFSLPANQPSSS